ncbi:20733_t:CDS:2 [Gigaspora margarita]|uniref:20733_t:CDS:1 n=1 Tax=Gigaspora margarita TaxID=4874 RepID=A0ABN7USY6_GIGMA|nr:20733_t:CDS:2 [Gigaspora margarita]
MLMKQTINEVKEAVIYIVDSYDKTSSISRTKHSSEQISLDEFLESTALPEKHQFFIEFLKQLRPAYTLPRKDQNETKNINLDEYDLDDDEGTVWENLNLLEIIDLGNNNFEDTDDKKT